MSKLGEPKYKGVRKKWVVGRDSQILQVLNPGLMGVVLITRLSLFAKTEARICALISD